MSLGKTLQAEGLRHRLHKMFGNIYVMETSSSEALNLWQRLRELTKTTGYYPLIVDQNMMKFYQEAMEQDGPETLEETLKEQNYNPRKTVEKGLQLDITKWLQEKMANHQQELAAYKGSWPRSKGREKKLQSDSLSILKTFSNGRPQKVLVDKLYIQFFPAMHSWEIPAYLDWEIMEEVIGWCGWGERPPAYIHSALYKYWYDLFGAEVISYTDDYCEMLVAVPPKNRKTALQLAKEQFVYCPDIVTQGTETIEGLAHALIDDPIWYFWWD